MTLKINYISDFLQSVPSPAGEGIMALKIDHYRIFWNLFPLPWERVRERVKPQI